MSSNLKCNSCGSTDIDVDPSRADAVCTNCGNVLESSIIVSDIQFEENAHGGSSAIGTFVSSESKGGGQFSGYGGSGGRGLGHFQSGLVRESREITLKNARKRIEALAQQLSLRRDRIDMAFHFFKLALGKHLTRGRKSTHVIAACVYITCRTESTPHMLIDFSDILQIDVYELGRTYLRLSQALCINIPAMDPCLYVMRFAHRLELGDKTHEVSMTALRLVSRMKKDWIHFGRRPSGLCGAALLIAARMHGYNRSVYDVIKVVKVHESTLRKRLNEFGETPASQLTLDEFMNIDLDAMTEEQDPPSFKAARKRDKERLLQLETEADLDTEMTELEVKIEDALDEMRAKMHKRGPYAKLFREAAEAKRDGRNESNNDIEPEQEKDAESEQAEQFIAEEILGDINEIVNATSDCADKSPGSPSKKSRSHDGGGNNLDSLLMPPPGGTPNRQASSQLPGLGLKDSIQDYLVPSTSAEKLDLSEKENNGVDESDDLDLTGIDDDEIDGYIMTSKEIEFKTKMWLKVNAEYLKEQAEKAERERLEAEEAEREGREIKKKPKKSKKATDKKANKSDPVGPGGHQTAIEAIEKIVAEKKISTKINYDVLKALSPAPNPDRNQDIDNIGSPGFYGHTPIDSPQSDKANSVFTPMLNSPVKRLASFKTRDLSLKRPVTGSPKTPPSLLGAASKRQRLNSDTSSTAGSLPPPSPRPVVVESGPVEPPSETEDFDEDEEPQSEDAMLSAKELLSKHTGETYGEEYEEEEYY